MLPCVRAMGLSTHHLGSGARQEEGPDDLQIGSYVFEVTLTSPLATTPSCLLLTLSPEGGSAGCSGPGMGVPRGTGLRQKPLSGNGRHLRP